MLGIIWKQTSARESKRDLRAGPATDGRLALGIVIELLSLALRFAAGLRLALRFGLRLDLSGKTHRPPPSAQPEILDRNRPTLLPTDRRLDSRGYEQTSDIRLKYHQTADTRLKCPSDSDILK